MKNSILIFLVILTGAVNVNGQNKKDLELKVDELRTEVDSLKGDYSNLSMMHDSTIAELASYQGMYDVVREKVLKYDFNPEDFDGIVDSLISGNDSVFTVLMEGSEVLRDTISLMSDNIEILHAQIDSQKVEIEVLEAKVVELSGPQAMVTDEQFEALKKLKELLDTEIITKEEFDARKKQILKE